MIKVIKRDGRKVDFDWSKITDDILKAYCDVYKETNSYPSYCIEIAKNIEEVARECDNILTVEDIQAADEVFAKLMGEEVGPRREFIEENATYANLDV